MSKRLWILILATVVGAMTIGVAPVVAQERCLPGAFCDRDGDGLFKQQRRCQRCGGEPDCDDNDPTNECADTGGEVIRRYAVRFLGALTGGNLSGGESLSGEDWYESTPNGGTVSKGVPGVGELDIHHFRTEFPGGANCFPEAGIVVILEDSASLYSRKGLAQADLNRFTACANDDPCSALDYGLEMEGYLELGKPWPPSGAVGDSHDLTMTGWSIFGVEKKTRNFSCSGEGTFPTSNPVTITVTRTR